MSDHVLWGSHPRYADGIPLKLEIGTKTECRAERRFRERQGGWTSLHIKLKGTP